MFERVHLWWNRRRYREGRVVSRFVAPDVRRDVHVLSTTKLADGVILARMRTVNVLYVHRGLVAAPEFDPPCEVSLDALWRWTGLAWGGLPDGTSLAGRQQRTNDEPRDP